MGGSLVQLEGALDRYLHTATTGRKSGRIMRGKRHNTSYIVDHNRGELIFTYHSTDIGTIENGKVYLRHGGWTTNSTKNHMNNFLDLCVRSGFLQGDHSIHQRQWLWCWNNGEEFEAGEVPHILLDPKEITLEKMVGNNG